MSEELRIFIRFLKDKDLKFTEQRRDILDVFLRTGKHLSVEDLYGIAKKKNSDIGQSTVFRTLKLLCEAGIAKEVDLGDGKTRYEREYGDRHHYHLICVKCGSLIETTDPKIEKLQDNLCKKNDFLPKRLKMQVFGICKKCK